MECIVLTRSRLALVLLVSVPLFLVVGCEDTQLAQRVNPYIADVPVPKGFERNVKESTYSSTTKARRILDVYEGGADPIKVRNFYKSYMPAQKWEFDDESLSGSIYTLNFSKGDERCTIIVCKRNEGGLFNPTEARVKIEAKAESN